METRKLHTEFLVGKLKRERPQGRPGRRWEYNIKIVLKVGGLEPE